jgi:uncharacterized protein (DUF433 family)
VENKEAVVDKARGMSAESRPSARLLYIVSDAARYTQATEGQVRRWLVGYDRMGGGHESFLQAAPERSRDKLALTFDNLIEVALVAALRAKGMSIQAIRKAHQVAEQEFGPFPFAQYPVYSSGEDIFIAASEFVRGQAEHLSALTKGGRRAWEPVLHEYLAEIDWREGWPIEWGPYRGVKLNPEVSFGLPNVSGIRTEIIRGRFMADESVCDIADDFGLLTDQVETALRYELTLRQAA